MKYALNKYLTSILLLVLCTTLSRSQNLVPNPSFENLSQCTVGNITLAPPWQHPPSHYGSTDVFNTCIGTNCLINGSVPNSKFGTAQPFHGNGYSGIITHVPGNVNYREYIQVQLTSPMVANQTYCVSFRVMRASRTLFAANNIGMHISNGPIGPSALTTTALTNIPQIEHTAIIRDSANWTLISGVYRAIGGEDYITIGNFRAGANTNSIIAGAGPMVAPCQSDIITDYTYYFIDSVSVEACTILLPIAGYTADSSICEGTCINYTDTSTEAISWSWAFEGASVAYSTLQHPVNICYPAAGVYSTTLEVANVGGNDVIIKTVTVHPKPVADFSASPNPVIGNSIVTINDQSTGATNWLWNFGDGSGAYSTVQNPSITYENSGQYIIELIATSEFGCKDTSMLDIVVESEYLFYVPNSFTPNGDGYNNTFFPIGDGIKNYQMWVYDRWGNLIWQSNTPNEPWDGKVRGSSKMAQQDVYVWKIKTIDASDMEHFHIGHINLIK